MCIRDSINAEYMGKMDFGSKRAYISKRKIEKLHEKKEPASQPAANDKMQDIKPEYDDREKPKHLSIIREEGIGKEGQKNKSRSRSSSYSSVSDEQLDEFGEAEEAPEPKAQEEKPKSSGGFLSYFSKASPPKEDSKEKAKKLKPQKKKAQAEPVFGLQAAPQMSVPLSVATGLAGVKHQQEVDTNVLSLKMSVLKDKSQIATGDPVVCPKCRAVLSICSKITKDPATNEQIWTCEFCNSSNKVSIEEEEMPKADELTYVIESAQQAMLKKGGGEDISIIFCIDVSGSMCVTQPLQGKIAVKYDKTKKMQDLMKFSDGSYHCLLYTSPSPRDQRGSRMPSSA
eukprot:TRINITY_DN16325_c0_g1_i1.p1 TRINITY_DN16325_c0_g1~~TRINITY_DN16325_c0_g1_i1.p1  ORF type:complete len:356 (-),score=157.36 TRINITY_DN16325_c0_g1_i1:11-1036(-)